MFFANIISYYNTLLMFFCQDNYMFFTNIIKIKKQRPKPLFQSSLLTNTLTASSILISNIWNISLFRNIKFFWVDNTQLLFYTSAHFQSRFQAILDKFFRQNICFFSACGNISFTNPVQILLIAVKSLKSGLSGHFRQESTIAEYRISSRSACSTSAKYSVFNAQPSAIRPWCILGIFHPGIRP